MANGNDERFNPNRRPQRPMTDDEAIEALKKAFPGSRMVNLNEDEDEDALREALSKQSSYDEDEFDPREMAEDAHLDESYESKYDTDYLDGYNGF